LSFSDTDIVGAANANGNSGDAGLAASVLLERSRGAAAALPREPATPADAADGPLEENSFSAERRVAGGADSETCALCGVALDALRAADSGRVVPG
jgi:hypothetical protein